MLSFGSYINDAYAFNCFYSFRQIYIYPVPFVLINKPLENVNSQKIWAAKHIF